MWADPMGVGRSWRRAARACLRGRGGSAAVEFALVAPLLLLLFAGITMFGLCLGVAHNLRQIAAEAARASVAGVTNAERASLAQSTVDHSLSAGALFKPSSVAVQVGSSPLDAAVYTVTLTVDATSLGLNAFSRLLPLFPTMLSSTVNVRRGGL